VSAKLYVCCEIRQALLLKACVYGSVHNWTADDHSRIQHPAPWDWASLSSEPTHTAVCVWLEYVQTEMSIITL